VHAQLVEAWRINQRVNLTLIDGISDEGMSSTLSKRGGRNVLRQFAHLHNNRIWHLQKRAKALAEDARLFETHEEPRRTVLKRQLEDSAHRIEQLIAGALAGTPGIRTMKRGIIPYVGYFIAHESHHRGSILLTLKQCGYTVDKSVAYGIWDWDRV
jgi:uncharacterized damage-inducible protein DinB